jgi:hypothetical protein
MMQKENKVQAAKKAASLGINLTVGKKPSQKVYFPEKLEQANKILSNIKFTHVK